MDSRKTGILENAEVKTHKTRVPNRTRKKKTHRAPEYDFRFLKTTDAREILFFPVLLHQLRFVPLFLICTGELNIFPVPNHSYSFLRSSTKISNKHLSIRAHQKLIHIT